MKVAGDKCQRLVLPLLSKTERPTQPCFRGCVEGSDIAPAAAGHLHRLPSGQAAWKQDHGSGGLDG